LKHVGALGSGLVYLSQYNLGWFCHSKVLRINEVYKVADLNYRLKLFSSHSLSICIVDSIDDGKLGYGFTSADELEEVDIGPGDKPRPTFISKKLSPYL
jgi:hypothetical protein